MRKLLSLFIPVLLMSVLLSCTDGSADTENMNNMPQTGTTAEVKQTTGVSTVTPSREQTPEQTAVQSVVPADTADTGSDRISREVAIKAALDHAGLTESDVWDIDAELDREGGSLIWEVDFDSREYDYSYDIDAQSGTVLRYEKDRD